MYLKSLILKGFKSFADRSVMALEPGITAVVGPNGSGKSNISDAVLWVLGERNAKHLRGQAMEDVIFAGSSARKATGVAEVVLVLDNSDGTLPVDFDEVAITRRMYRSGESEYLINGTPARRMDVLDILHDSGLGTGTHSIISQGSLDSILQSRPEDRRALIEEAAGVLKHKQRKAKSERKLEVMNNHLLRARDVAAEVERQLGPLSRKARKATTYKELSVQLADINLRLAVDDLRTLQGQWREAEALEQKLSTELEERRQAITEAESLLETLQERIRRESLDAGELAKHYREASAAVERLDSAALVIHERRRSASARAAELSLEVEAATMKRTVADGELRRAESALVEVAGQRSQADERVQTLQTQLQTVENERNSLEREASQGGRDLRNQENEVETLRRKRAETRETLSNGLAHQRVIEGHVSELELELSRANADAEAAERERAAAEEALATVQDQEATARKLVGSCLQARDAARTALEDARDAEHAISAQIRALDEVERASRAAAGPARAWLEAHGEEFPGIDEPLSQVLRVDTGYEQLVEALLGSDVAALLVENIQCALTISEGLAAAQESGEVSLLLCHDQNSERKRALSLSRSDTSQGVALIEHLHCPDELQGAVNGLLGDVVVCQSVAEALEAHEQESLPLRFVTPEGDVVWPSGKVVLGTAVQEGDEGVLARVRHREELKVGLAEAQESCEKVSKQATEAEEALRQAQASSLDLGQRLAALKGTAEAARSQAERASEKLAAVRREMESVQAQRAEAEALINSARPDVESLDSQITELEQAVQTAKEQQRARQEALAPLRRQVQELNESLSEAKLAAARLAERESYNRRMRDSRSQELDSLAKQAEESKEVALAKTISAKRLAPVLTLLEEIAGAARRWTRDLEEKTTAAQDSSTGLHGAVSEARENSHKAHGAFDEINERFSEARVEKGRLELKVDVAMNVITADCATPLEVALALPPLEDRPLAEEEAFRLNRRIANLGTINLDAAEEYEELKTRYDYLARQLGDLEAARKTLQKINRVIDERMKDDFLRTYEAVNQNFSEIFALLFPGGNANLSLVDPEDIENSGVEVNAQPRGKRITKMMLMSGGEKSLTALALLFAVYKTRSTPFYILDEVEAALDDTNLRRLIAYIEAMRDSTQMIMITHQRRTMEAADVLFGVSMQADGVTKVISQKLDRALQYAE